MLYLLIAIIAFVIIDFIIRYILKNIKEKKEIQSRQQVLEETITINYSHEVTTLKRAEVKNPKAKILCVDDEDIILDSFRKILVLDGYSVDTVSRGREALTLIRTNHYDFVFTDLKMPEMDGLEVTKTVKYLRPDIDVVIITGYATVETAVDCMKYGALDYVQKPFTEDEVLKFTENLLIRRKENLKARLQQRVHVTNQEMSDKLESYQLAIPGGVFISKNHCWVSLQQDGSVKVGIDEFAMRLIHHFDSVEFPVEGGATKTDQPLFIIRQQNRSIPFNSPISGVVTKINIRLKNDLESLVETTYKNNWICIIEPTNLEDELNDLKIGKTAVAYYNEQLEKIDLYIKDNLKGILPESVEALNFTDIEAKKYDQILTDILKG